MLLLFTFTDTWFDRDELSRIVEFIRAGGLEAARAKEKTQLEEARHQLHAQQLGATSRSSSLLGVHEEEHRITGIVSARGLLKILLD